MNNFPQYRDRQGDEWTRFEDGLLYLTTSWRSERTRKGYTFGFVDRRFGPLTPIPAERAKTKEEVVAKRPSGALAEAYHDLVSEQAREIERLNSDLEISRGGWRNLKRRCDDAEARVANLKLRLEESKAEQPVKPSGSIVLDNQPDPQERSEAISSLADLLLRKNYQRLGSYELAELIVDKSALVWLSSDKRQLREQVKDLQQKNSTLSRQLGKLRDAVRELYRQV